jgi:hypothetical protein
MGLYMTRAIAAAAGGTFILQSHAARFIATHDSERYERCAYWQGTLVQVVLHPAQIPAFVPLFQSIVARTTGHSGQPVRFGEGPREALRLVPPVDASGFAADKAWFSAQREEVQRELADGGLVAVDFRGARYSTQSALHALLYVPLRQLGPETTERIWFENAGPQIRAVLRQVVHYALDHHAPG